MADTTCTGLSAHWCPRCGDCACERAPEGGPDFTTEACPLHGASSRHSDDHEESVDDLIDRLTRELADARAAVATHEADLAAAAGELLVPLPTPGTVTAKLLAANVLMRRRNERFNALVNCARRESEARAAWLASIPTGACTSPPSQALLDAETATRAALREIEACS